jgi:hypothetical protein
MMCCRFFKKRVKVHFVLQLSKMASYSMKNAVSRKETAYVYCAVSFPSHPQDWDFGRLSCFRDNLCPAKRAVHPAVASGFRKDGSEFLR